MKPKTLEEQGEEIFNNFRNTIFKEIDVSISTPRTNTLKLFALLNNKEQDTLLVGALCDEIAEQLHEPNIFVKDDDLFQKTEINEKFYYSTLHHR